MLVNRNVVIGGHRTSLRLEVEMWEALDDICWREGLILHQLFSMIDEARRGASRTSTTRSFIVRYFRHNDAPGGRVANALQMATGLGRWRSIGLGRGFSPRAGIMPAPEAAAGGE